VKTSHSTTETAEPAASHEALGCRRLGDSRNSSAIAATTSRMLSGQSSTDQAVRLAPLKPLALAMSWPAISSTNATTDSSPAVTVSRAALAYFCSDGRSRSMP